MAKKNYHVYKGHKLNEYNKKYGNKNYSVVNKVDADKDIKLLENKSWWLIEDKYYEVPQSKCPPVAWFKNINTAGKAAVCILGAGVIATAVAVPIAVSVNQNSSDIIIEPTKQDQITTKSKTDSSGNTVVTLTPKDTKKEVASVTVKKGDQTLDGQSEYHAKQVGNDFEVTITKEAMNKYPGKVTIDPLIKDKTPEVVHVESVKLDKTSLNLNAKTEPITLIASISPSNATDKSVSWVSSNPNVVSVDSNGKVTALKAGSAVITVTTTDGNKTATCSVNVNQLVESIKITNVITSVYTDKKIELTAEVLPNDATKKDLDWSVSSYLAGGAAEIVKEDGKVYLKGKKAGTVMVVASATDGSREYCIKEFTIIESYVEIECSIGFTKTKLDSGDIEVTFNKLDDAKKVTEVVLKVGSETLVETTDYTFDFETSKIVLKKDTVVSHAGKTVSITPTIEAPTKVYSDFMPRVLNIFEGESLNTNYFNIKAEYKNGTLIADATDLCTFEPALGTPYTTSLREQKITIAGQTFTVPVVVGEKHTYDKPGFDENAFWNAFSQVRSVTNVFDNQNLRMVNQKLLDPTKIRLVGTIGGKEWKVVGIKYDDSNGTKKFASGIYLELEQKEDSSKKYDLCIMGGKNGLLGISDGSTGGHDAPVEISDTKAFYTALRDDLGGITSPLTNGSYMKYEGGAKAGNFKYTMEKGDKTAFSFETASDAPIDNGFPLLTYLHVDLSCDESFDQPDPANQSILSKEYKPAYDGLNKEDPIDLHIYYGDNPFFELESTDLFNDVLEVYMDAGFSMISVRRLYGNTGDISISTSGTTDYFTVSQVGSNVSVTGTSKGEGGFVNISMNGRTVKCGVKVS